MANMFIVGLVCTVIGVVASIMSTAIPYWIYAGDRWKGLWESCKTDACTRYGSSAPDWLHCCQAMMIIGTLFPIAGAVIACKMQKRQLSGALQLAGALCLLGGVCCLIAATVYMVYAAKFEEDNHLHAGFVLAIVASASGVLGGVLLCKTNHNLAGYSAI